MNFLLAARFDYGIVELPSYKTEIVLHQLNSLHELNKLVLSLTNQICFTGHTFNYHIQNVTKHCGVFINYTIN